MAAAAGLATLEVLRRPGAYEKVFATGRELMAGMSGMLEKAGLPAQVIGVPPLFDIVYATGDIADYRGMAARRYGDAAPVQSSASARAAS